MAKRKSSEPNYDKVRVTHIMADGTIRDSVAGLEVPYNEYTAVAYDILDKAWKPLLDYL